MSSAIEYWLWRHYLSLLSMKDDVSQNSSNNFNITVSNKDHKLGDSMLLDLIIPQAHAQEAAANPIVSLLPMVLIFVLFYFLLIRPQQKRAKAHRQMIANLKTGDEIVTAGGFVGSISDLDEQFAKVKIAENTEVKVQRASIAQLLPKGSI